MWVVWHRIGGFLDNAIYWQNIQRNDQCEYSKKLETGLIWSLAYWRRVETFETSQMNGLDFCPVEFIASVSWCWWVPSFWTTSFSKRAKSPTSQQIDNSSFGKCSKKFNLLLQEVSRGAWSDCSTLVCRTVKCAVKYKTKFLTQISLF